MEKKKKPSKYKWLIIITAIAVPSFTFYWHEVRTSNIRKKCTDYTINHIGINKELNTREDFTWVYKMCLGKNGIKE